MSRIIIHGGRRLYGRVSVQGSKNAVLPIMAASLLNSGTTIIRNCPDIADVRAMRQILEYLGCETIYKNRCIKIDSKGAVYREISEALTGAFRASSVLMGPMLARFGKVKIAQPGGCLIGDRPLDIHLKGFKQLGAAWTLDNDWIEVNSASLKGNFITLRFPSVGATQNIIMAAVLSKGKTVIRNAAREPEIIDLCGYLKKAGAKIFGEGSNNITIIGVNKLQEADYTVQIDRIAAGSYLSAVLAAGGGILLEPCSMHELRGFLDIFTGMGMEICSKENCILAKIERRPTNLNMIQTAVYPGFPTDMQSLILSAAAVADGRLCIKERIFENRFQTVSELKKMGAELEIAEDTVWVNGVDRLKAAPLEAKDLRGCAALVVAALAAEGKTVIHNADYLLRGYEDFCENLNILGADIRWEKD